MVQPLILVTLLVTNATVAVSPVEGDKAYDLVGASWVCTSFQDEQKTEVFELSDAGTLLESTTDAEGGNDASSQRRYVFDAAKDLWQLSWPTAGGTLTAAPWAHAHWTFEGVLKRQRVRVTFTSYGPPAFRRDVESFVRGRWTELNGETCKRFSR
jgi:hypothetical protein